MDYYIDILKFNPKTHSKYKKYKNVNIELMNKGINFIHPTLELIITEDSKSNDVIME